jgi:hypothetical protein
MIESSSVCSGMDKRELLYGASSDREWLLAGVGKAGYIAHEHADT